MRTNTLFRRFLSALALVASLVGVTTSLTACSTNQNVDMSTVTAVIDVRTPAEFATGHLDGAINIDWEGPTFADEVSALDPNGTYLLYCRSGNRAGQAKAAMESLGFTNLTNLGSVEDASTATGIAIVTG